MSQRRRGREDAGESIRRMRDALCFSIETGAVGREGRQCQTAVAGYGRLWSEYAAL